MVYCITRRHPMPSPFPGMDPYLESPRRWLDFHNALAAEIAAALNAVLNSRYAAWLPSYTTHETLEIAPAPVESALPMEVPVRLYRVEIRLIANEQLVT